jgi:hypothetical protein
VLEETPVLRGSVRTMDAMSDVNERQITIEQDLEFLSSPHAICGNVYWARK